MRVLVACEFSGIVRDAFTAKGHDAWSCDLLETERPGNHIVGDVLQQLDMGWDLMIAHPPCDHLAVSGARWFEEKRKDGRQQQGIDFFMALANAPIEKIALENPVSIMSTKWRKPDQYVHPWQFGHGETKKTGLWIKNLPLLVPTEVVKQRENRIHRLSALNGVGSSKNRKQERSRTFTGIAQAMADQWGVT